MYQELVDYIALQIRIYRARRVEHGQALKHVDLTAPPPEKSGSNRMSPAGISFFYGALELDTAIAEVRPGLGDQVAVGVFKARRSLTVFDLTQIPHTTSPFSENLAFRFEEFVRPFLEEFAADISKPIRPDDSAIDYVPAQIFTEFVRYSKLEPDVSIDGIVYRSSIREGGKCVVLFKGSEVSCTARKSTDQAWLTYVGHKKRVITGIEYGHKALRSRTKKS